MAKTSGPPMAAPTPMLRISAVGPVVTAMRVTTDSGSAVPNAARMVPTAMAPS